MSYLPKATQSESDMRASVPAVDADERDRQAIAFRLGVPWERLVELLRKDAERQCE